MQTKHVSNEPISSFCTERCLQFSWVDRRVDKLSDEILFYFNSSHFYEDDISELQAYKP